MNCWLNKLLRPTTAALFSFDRDMKFDYYTCIAALVAGSCGSTREASR